MRKVRDGEVLTKWLTNDHFWAHLLGKSGWGGSVSLEWRRNVRLEKGPVKPVPTELARASNLFWRGAVFRRELHVAGPTAEGPEPVPRNEQCWDDVNVRFFDPEITKRARRTELDWVRREKVYYLCSLAALP